MRASQVKFTFSMTDTLRLWKETINEENNKDSEDKHDPMEPA
jgi:hypothetical protein